MKKSINDKFTFTFTFTFTFAFTTQQQKYRNANKLGIPKADQSQTRGQQQHAPNAQLVVGGVRHEIGVQSRSSSSQTDTISRQAITRSTNSSTEVAAAAQSQFISVSKAVL